MEGRLHLLLQKLNAVSEKKAAIEDADRQGKVAEMYDFVKKLEPLTSLLPTVIDRLVALQVLHEEGNADHNCLSRIRLAY